MNGDTKQILHLLKVCSFVWEEAKPWMSTVGLYKGGKQDSVCIRRGEKVKQGERHGRDSNDLGTALCDSVAKDWSAAELRLQILLAARLLNDGTN